MSIRGAQYTALSGATITVMFDVREVLKAGGMDYANANKQMEGVLRCVRVWNITDAKPSLTTFRERVPVDVAEGVATAMIYAAAGRRLGAQ